MVRKVQMVAGMMLALSSAAQAQVLYSTDFDAPLYTAGGTVHGIDGWSNGSGGGASHSISTALASVGGQSLHWDNTGLLSFYSVRRPLPPITEMVTASVDVWITGNTEPLRLYGIYFVSSPTSTLGGNVLGVTIGGDGTVRGGPAWSNTYSNNNIIGVAEPGSYLDRWITLTLTWEPVTGEGTIEVSGLDGSPSSIFAAFADVSIPQGLNLGSDYNALQTRSGMAYMDNLVIQQGTEVCYPNCDGSTTEPILTVDDFTCFINEFAVAQTLPYSQQVTAYANCDGSTTEPVLTVDDFTCFINAFAQGCP